MAEQFTEEIHIGLEYSIAYSSKIYMDIPYLEFKLNKKSGVLESLAGYGNTLEQCAKDYCNKIKKYKVLIYKASDEFQRTQYDLKPLLKYLGTRKMKLNHWYVIETPCYPSKWKVVNDCYRMDNAPYRYFRSKPEAGDRADELNIEERKKIDLNLGMG